MLLSTTETPSDGSRVRPDRFHQLLDQAHKQANAVVKANGGAIGVAGDSVALRWWMVTGPEVYIYIYIYIYTKQSVRSWRRAVIVSKSS